MLPSTFDSGRECTTFLASLCDSVVLHCASCFAHEGRRWWLKFLTIRNSLKKLERVFERHFYPQWWWLPFNHKWCTQILTRFSFAREFPVTSLPPSLLPLAKDCNASGSPEIFLVLNDCSCTASLAVRSSRGFLYPWLIWLPWIAIFRSCIFSTTGFVSDSVCSEYQKLLKLESSYFSLLRTPPRCLLILALKKRIRKKKFHNEKS